MKRTKFVVGERVFNIDGEACEVFMISYKITHTLYCVKNLDKNCFQIWLEHELFKK